MLQCTRPYTKEKTIITLLLRTGLYSTIIGLIVKWGAETLTLTNEMESINGVGKESIGKNIGENI